MQEIIRSVRQLLRVLAPELVSNSGPSCQERKEGGLPSSVPPSLQTFASLPIYAPMISAEVGMEENLGSRCTFM